MFASLVYTKFWISCPNPTLAPLNDLTFLKTILQHKAINNGISTAAVTAFLRQLWYLSEEMVALAFFDNETSNEKKAKMVLALQNAG